MLSLAAAKGATGDALGNRTLQTESRVTLIDAYLASLFYALREAREALA